MPNQGMELHEFGPFRLDPKKRLLMRIAKVHFRPSGTNFAVCGSGLLAFTAAKTTGVRAPLQCRVCAQIKDAGFSLLLSSHSGIS